MFKVIRIPVRYSNTISRFSDEEISILIHSLISIWNWKMTPLPNNILGDTISLIYGDWMNMEARNWHKPVKSLVYQCSEWPGTVPPSDPAPVMKWNEVKCSVMKCNEMKWISKPLKIKIFEGDSFEYSCSKFFLDDLVSRQVPSILYQLTQKTEDSILQARAVEVSNMLRLDWLTHDQIREIIKFTVQDEFWSTVILSMNKFRKKKDWIPYFITIINKIKDSWWFKKDTSQMSWDEALAEAKRRWLV